MRHLFPVLFLSLACCGAAVAKSDPIVIVAHERATLTEGAAKGRERHLLLVAGDRQLALTLAPNEALLAAVDATTRASALAGGNEFLAGRVDGISGSWARLSRVGGEWTGAIHDGRELLLVDPVAQVRGKLLQPVTAGTGLVVYRLGDVHAPDRIDGIVTPLSYPALVPPAALAPDVATKRLDLSVVADGDFSAVHGANANAVIASRINTVDGIYSDQVGVQIVAANVTLLPGNGTLTATNSSTLLEQFRLMVAGGQVPRGDLTHLMSGKDFDGSTVGVAYLGVLCHSTHGVGINQVRSANQTTALTIAHEMGHNFGAPHDGEGACVGATPGIMNPSLNGSTTFSSCSRTQMADDVAAAACLAPIAGGGEPPIFRHGFE